jgi:signal peptidase I
VSRLVKIALVVLAALPLLAFLAAIGSVTLGLSVLVCIMLSVGFEYHRYRRVPGRSPWRSTPAFVGLWISTWALAGLVAARFERFRVLACSMAPTLLAGDRFYAVKVGSKLSRGEVVIANLGDNEYPYRVIALGGDRIEIRDNVPFVNGRAVERSPIPGPTRYDSLERGKWSSNPCETFLELLDGNAYTVLQDAPSKLRSWPAQTIPPGYVFLLGDNRDQAQHDSRSRGPVPVSWIKSEPMLIWWSVGPEGIRWDRIGRKLEP